MQKFLENLGPYRSLIWAMMICMGFVNMRLASADVLIMDMGVGLFCGFLVGLRVSASE